jgi:hypothetical protein
MHACTEESHEKDFEGIACVGAENRIAEFSNMDKQLHTHTHTHTHRADMFGKSVMTLTTSYTDQFSYCVTTCNPI